MRWWLYAMLSVEKFENFYPAAVCGAGMQILEFLASLLSPKSAFRS